MKTPKLQTIFHTICTGIGAAIVFTFAGALTGFVLAIGCQQGFATGGNPENMQGFNYVLFGGAIGGLTGLVGGVFYGKKISPRKQAVAASRKSPDDAQEDPSFSHLKDLPPEEVS